ncbi:uncharacterized protein TNCV_810011 [Trichonephila clavipes]|uniref:Uncharacterized protein n=1 Tax=Trichonephila clavipes TaxID=2585209 RepID=A0A8X6SKB7_TRICX|nr:uncharacterized protein TNCV_810011 [Trichonephila clavipes]
MRPILAYACPVWGYAAKTNINILDTLQNSLIRMIVKAIRYMRNDHIRKALKINSFKSHIQNIAINFFNDLETKRKRKLDLTGASEMNRLYPNSRRESGNENQYLKTLPRRGEDGGRSGQTKTR